MTEASALNPEFWLKRWQDADTGFHRDRPQALLVEHWHRMTLTRTDKVLVPLCGRSSDMVWLAKQGHTVIGSELSPIAVDQFFKDIGHTPDVEQFDSLTRKSSGPFEIWQGDLFQLNTDLVGQVDAIYDRAALVALPPNTQKLYATLLSSLLKPDGKLFLISLDYDPNEMDGPPFSTSPETINDLFQDSFDVELIATNPDALDDSENLKKRGLTALNETLSILTKTSVTNSEPETT